MEVTENLLSNALRHGKRQIPIMVETGYAKLSICVMDDGEGFREDAEKITKAFYGQNAKDSLKHAGWGCILAGCIVKSMGENWFWEIMNREGPWRQRYSIGLRKNRHGVA